MYSYLFKRHLPPLALTSIWNAVRVFMHTPTKKNMFKRWRLSQLRLVVKAFYFLCHYNLTSRYSKHQVELKTYYRLHAVKILEDVYLSLALIQSLEAGAILTPLQTKFYWIATITEATGLYKSKWDLCFSGHRGKSANCMLPTSFKYWLLSHNPFGFWWCAIWSNKILLAV